jgi:hypothetical protein
MGINFKYKITEINYKDGIITVEYSRSDNLDTTVSINLIIPFVDRRYLSGSELEQFVLQSFPAHAFVSDVIENDNITEVEVDVEYDNTQLKFEGDGVYVSDVDVQGDMHPSDLLKDEDRKYLNDVKENFSVGTAQENAQLKRAVMKILEELNILK